MNSTFHGLRRLSGALLLLVLIGLPFLRVNGNSAMRFDVPSLRLYFFGTAVWMQDFFIVLIAVFFFTFLTLLVTTVFGRVWCGWLCPQTVLADATMFVEAARKRGYTARGAAAAAGLCVSAVISASLIGYFVSPYDLPVLLRTGGTPANIVAGSWAAMTILLFLDLFALRRSFCATACPYAKMQGVLFDDRTLLVAFDPLRADECMHCNACVKICPVGIDIRKGTQSACIHCAECVDACTEKMAGRNKRSLVRYMFGIPGSRGTGIRINPLITGGLTAISLIFLVYLSATRMPFDMMVRLNFAGGQPVLIDGSVTNSYIMSVRNMAEAELNLELQASTTSGTVQVAPETVVLKQGTKVATIPVSVKIQKRNPAEHFPGKVTLSLVSKPLKASIAKTVYVMLPKE